MNQREGLETDLSQVLQTETVFTNVSRGDIATNEDLVNVFGTTNHRKICEQIIKEGHLQVSDKEREYISESRTRDVLNLVCQMTMDAVTGFPLTVTQVQAALDDIHFRVSAKSSLKGSRSTKQRDEEEEVKQIARECVKKLETELPHRISRVNMILKLIVNNVDRQEIEDLAEKKCVIKQEDEQTFVLTCHPRLFKILKDSLGPRLESISVVDSFVHQILPNSTPPPPPKPTLNTPQVIEIKSLAPVTSLANTCATCGNSTFESIAEFRIHCKSEWHSFNKKRQIKGLTFIDHMEFEMIPDEIKSAFNAVDP